MTPEEFDADPRLRLDHLVGEPVAILNGYLDLLRSGDVDLDEAITPMAQAALDLGVELRHLGKIVVAARGSRKPLVYRRSSRP